ncbi:MAG TPA: shikimate dehydrogenase [Terracidiphilus sp.]|nr:shikimate dehydrogenase [Terracidiphilus sp.]
MKSPAPIASVRKPARHTARPGKICVAIQAPSPAEMIARAEAALHDTKFLEFRLDSLPAPEAALPTLRRFLVRNPHAAAIATCRRKPNGGAFAGSLDQELEILRKAARAGCRIVDLEIESAEEAAPTQLEKFRAALVAAGAALLISYHDFSRTRQLQRAADRIAAFEPDIVKVVSTAQTLADNLAVLRLIEDRAGAVRIVSMAMGEEGLPSRVLAPREGSLFTFASLADGEETAPGQVTAPILRKLYRPDKIASQTRIFGVAGNPIAHSLSPLMQNTAFRRAGVDSVLLPLKVRALADLLTFALELPLGGIAITMPLKQEILPHLAQMDPLVERIGACNTVRIAADGKLAGYNTDVAGVVRPLERRLRLKGARIALLGAGGAARAAAFGLVEQGAEVFLINRTHENAVRLARAAGATALRHEKLGRMRFDALINSTPCGMAGSKEPLPLAPDELNADLVFDMVYNPMETPLLKLARARGIPVITGVEMFVQQGARQFEIWTGKAAPEAEMRRVVERELQRRQ